MKDELKKSIIRWSIGIFLIVMMWLDKEWALYTLVTLSLIGVEATVFFFNVQRKLYNK